MKRFIALSVLFLAAFTPSLLAQDDPVVAAARREEAEERYKTMTTKLERLEETVHLQQQTITKLAEELRNLRDDVSRVAGTSKEAASQESLRGLAEAIKEVDQKRISDNKNVLNRFTETMNEIQKVIRERSPAPAPRPSPGNNTGPPAPPPDGGPSVQMYTVTVSAGDSLGLLLTKLNKQGVKITKKQLMDANPLIKDWQKIRPGDKVFVPKPQ